MKITFADQLRIPQATLDLHDFGSITPMATQVEVREFLENSYAEGLNKVLIITGKGLNSPKGPRLKPNVINILKQMKIVKAFESAAADRGGEGALEVYFVDL